MKGTENIRCEIKLQKGEKISAEFPMNTLKTVEERIGIRVTEKAENGCRIGMISVHIENTSFLENAGLEMEKPVRIWLPLEKPEKITAMYLYNAWWTRPAFVKSFREIPEHTQTAFFQYKDRYSCIVLPAGREFKTYLTGGTETEICLEMTAGLGGKNVLEELLYIQAEAPSVYEAVHKAFTWLAEFKGIRMREERRIPEMFRYLGWCSWDAFYKEVSEEGISRKADEFAKKEIPVRWMLIDDGWMTAQDELLADFRPDPEKFPEGFRQMTEEIRKKTDVRWFGVWHALGGYWGGIAPGSSLDLKESAYLYRTVNGKILPSPFKGEKFYRDWYKVLNREGISFVKVDGQSSVPCYFENSLPVCEAARGLNEALESGASRMDGAVINCMGMAMENILARPATAVSRNSDDFFPDKEGGFAEHLLQNAYNSLYHNELYCCDWDMFWTVHKDAVKHSLLRAVSGGPVYVSDRPGATDPAILKPLAYQDGKILMMDRSAKPAEDCIFSDPLSDGVLKLHNSASCGNVRAGGIAVFNLTKQKQTFSVSPADIPNLETADLYWVYDYFNRTAFPLEWNETYEAGLETDGYKWFVFLPSGKNGVCPGLLDKYAGFTAVEHIYESRSSATVVLHESGTTGWISHRKPRRILANDLDVTDIMEQRGNLCTVKLPENSSGLVLTFLWE